MTIRFLVKRRISFTHYFDEKKIKNKNSLESNIFRDFSFVERTNVTQLEIPSESSDDACPYKNAREMSIFIFTVPLSPQNAPPPPTRPVPFCRTPTTAERRYQRFTYVREHRALSVVGRKCLSGFRSPATACAKRSRRKERTTQCDIPVGARSQ